VTKKRFALIATVSGIAVVLLTPVSYYCFFALVRHEHFYHGLPTSYWARAIKRWDPDSSRTPSSVPYLDTVLNYLGFTGVPSVAQGDVAAVPVLLQLIATSDKEVAPKACLALAQSIPDAKKEINLWESREGYAANLGNRIIIGLPYVETWGLAGFLILIEPDGRYLDCLDFSIRVQSRHFAFAGQFEHAVEKNETQLVVRYALGANESIADFAQIASASAATADGHGASGWELFGEINRTGLLRVAVENSKFRILWPPHDRRDNQ
jgi:hypothetical protein